ncbi:MAG TPA: histidine kinase [Pseudacidobacterium sp.]|nr:histidine kinase [Pseudacidobacterium sp.]
MGSIAIAEDAAKSHAALRVTFILHVSNLFSKGLTREQAIAILRLAISILLIASVDLNHISVWHHEAVLRLILSLYALYSLAIVTWVFARTLSWPLLNAIYTFDVAWPALMCLFSGILHSPFLLLFVFAPVVSAYRRTARATIVVTAASMLVILLEAVIANGAAASHFLSVERPQPLGSFAIKAAIFLASGAFLSYWAYQSEQEYQAYIVRAALERLHPRAGIQANLKQILTFFLDIFGAKKAVLVLRNVSGSRLFMWEAERERHGLVERRNVPCCDAEMYLSPMPAESWSTLCSRWATRPSSVLLDRHGRRLKASGLQNNPYSQWIQPFRTLLAVNLQLGSEWTGRVFLVDASCVTGRETSLRLLWQLVQNVGSNAYSFYLSQHSRARVRDMERQRTARELHDGVIQSLIFTEMHVDLLRRQLMNPGIGVNTEETLTNVQLLLRREIQDLRRQIEQLRSSAAPRLLLPRLSEIVENFQCETGIAASFVSDVQDKSISGRISHEVTRIVEEALTNVRKHSGAQKVEVQLVSNPDDTWQVVIQDDGCGFDFSGRLSLAQLEAARKGPRVIRERVHSVNGDLALESYPGRGARLEIRFACK